MASGGISRGVDAINESNAQRAKEQGGGYVPQLNLGKGEVARIRFLSDPISYNCHQMNDQEARRTYYRWCAGNDGDGELCDWCNAGHRARPMFMFWVWVAIKLHKTPDEEGKWESVKYRRKQYFQENVNRVFVLRRGMGRANSTYDMFANFYLENGTWFDREYIWSRNEAERWQDTAYDLLPKDPEEESDFFVNVKDQLPDLALVAMEKLSRGPRFDDNGDLIPDEEDDGPRNEPERKSPAPPPQGIEDDGEDDEDEDGDVPW